jgi:hypothetical protein
MVPTFDIAKLALVGTPQNRNIGASVAGAASLANPITSAITPVSGANALTGFRLPRGFRGVFVVIPAGACTGATGGSSSRKMTQMILRIFHLLRHGQL